MPLNVCFALIQFNEQINSEFLDCTHNDRLLQSPSRSSIHPDGSAQKQTTELNISLYIVSEIRHKPVERNTNHQNRIHTTLLYQKDVPSCGRSLFVTTYLITADKSKATIFQFTQVNTLKLFVIANGRRVITIQAILSGVVSQSPSLIESLVWADTTPRDPRIYFAIILHADCDNGASSQLYRTTSI